MSCKKEKIQSVVNDLRSSEEIYEILKNPILRTASDMGKCVPALAPVVSLSDNVALASVERRIVENRHKLVEMLRKCKPNITLDDINNADFILDYAKLQEAVERLRSNEKIEFLASLFAYYHIDVMDADLEEYDEMLRRINELSMREIKLLKLLDDHLKTCDEFYRVAEAELALDKDMVNSMLTSLTKTGFCKEKTGAILDYSGNSFSTTVLFDRFLKIIGVERNSDEARETERVTARNSDGVISFIPSEDIEEIFKVDRI